jgi:small-conductance mechanosensitive channel
VIEDSIDDNSKFPIVKDTKIKQICRMVLEFLKIIVNYLKYYIDASQKSKTKDE